MSTSTADPEQVRGEPGEKQKLAEIALAALKGLSDLAKDTPQKEDG